MTNYVTVRVPVSAVGAARRQQTEYNRRKGWGLSRRQIKAKALALAHQWPHYYGVKVVSVPAPTQQ